MNGIDFDWEGAFGSLTHDRLEQLQKYAREQDYVSKFSLENLPHERTMEEEGDNNKMINKKASP